MDSKGRTMAAKQHIEEIRKNNFWIGVGKNPLSRTVSKAVKYLSDELYSKDVHFLMELIQNAEDNEYPEGVEPSLEFIITSKDITGTKAPATLLIFNNEKGFSRKNMTSICDVGNSTKAGNKKHGYIGEKGIGFKSVFLLTGNPYIFSNGYQIRFSETPCSQCDIAYIVPEWVDDKPTLSDIKRIYGASKELPTTTLILPLKPGKVEAVKEQLSSLHPELLLFLSKIKRLSVKEDITNPNLNSIRAISISSESDYVSKKSVNAESYTLHLAAEDSDNLEAKCCYYIWKQRFPVMKKNKVEKRIDIDEWTITLAFPFGNRLNRGMTSVGIYSFLPTEIVTDFPFIIQADFLLPSSRETILWDNVWNRGILDCVPTSFVNAFVSLVRTREDTPSLTLAPMFNFLPVKQSSHPKLNVIRDLIREKLLQEQIIPSECHSAQKFFHKPQEVGRLMPSFWKVLLKAKEGGAKLHNLSSLGKHILDSSFDKDKYNAMLNFLGIKLVEIGWYPKCIQSCNLVLGVGENVYTELLNFLAISWRSFSEHTAIKGIPLLHYIDASGNVSLLSVTEACDQYKLCRPENSKHISWLIDSSKEFRSVGKVVFLPLSVCNHIPPSSAVFAWLRDNKIVQTVDVFQYGELIHNALGNNRILVLGFAHFLYLSYSNGFINKSKVKQLCNVMPLLNSYGSVSVKREGVLIPANGSDWVELLGPNPWASANFVELAEDYLHQGRYAGHTIPKNALVKFLQSCAGASDIPDICPPNAPCPSVSGPLTKSNAFLLFDWIEELNYRGVVIPNEFMSSIRDGNWLRVTISGCAVYKPPSQSFYPTSSWGCLLQGGSDMVDIPVVDQKFYGNKINDYEEELKAIGVMSECGEACKFIGEHLMSSAKYYNLTATKVVAMLNFIRFLREKYLPVDKFINAIKKVKWVRTSCGERLPGESILYDSEWEAASFLSLIPFIDQGYYGNEILNYKEELRVLGVVVGGFKSSYQVVIDHVKPSSSLNSLKARPLLLALQCIRNCQSSGKLVSSLKDAECLKTNIGYFKPDKCFLFDRKWGCILKVFEGFPLIDKESYGSQIGDYKSELGKIGVMVDVAFAVKAFCDVFKQRASSKSITKDNVLSFLGCYKKLSDHPLVSDLRACVREAKWLRTRVVDFRSPKDSILYSSEWKSISQITILPFIEDSDRCYGSGIHEFRSELEEIGVMVDIGKGQKLIFEHIFFPFDPSEISPKSVVSLLQCIKTFTSEGKEIIPENFLNKIRQTKWLKTTTCGYQSPKECLLFDYQQSSLQRVDGPFVDDEFYGKVISSYKKELGLIGVIVKMGSSDGSSLLARHIESQSEFPKIVRIYDYLTGSDWKPSEGDDRRVWVPTSDHGGVWASPKDCLLHDGNGLFSTQFHILDKHYKSKLLMFFRKAFEVRRSPSTNDYCMLWMEWEKSRHNVSQEECCAFWSHVIGHWSSGNGNDEMISQSVTKLPTASSDDIPLVNKQEVFLPDDLLLKDLFEKSTTHPLFVWLPKKNIPSVSRASLQEIYAKIGVKKISEAVIICDVSDSKCTKVKRVNLEDGFISKGLVMLILSFLGDPSLNIEVKQRHESVKALLNVTVFEAKEPITMSYNLKMGSSGKVVKISTSQIVRWERESSKFFTQKLDKGGGQRSVLEYATRFSQTVSEGLLWENENHIPRLADLIKVGFLTGFDVDAIDYFLKSKNLELSVEDKEFLASTGGGSSAVEGWSQDRLRKRKLAKFIT